MMVAAIDTRTKVQAYIDLFGFAVGMDEEIASVDIVRGLYRAVHEAVREPMEHPADAYQCVSHSCPRPACVLWRIAAPYVIRS